MRRRRCRKESNARHTQVGFRRFKCNEKKCRYDEDTNTCVSPKLERLLKDLADTRAQLEASRARQAKLDRDLEKEKLHIEELDRTKREINEVAEFVRTSFMDRSRILRSPREERVSKIDELISSYEATGTRPPTRSSARKCKKSFSSC